MVCSLELKSLDGIKQGEKKMVKKKVTKYVVGDVYSLVDEFLSKHRKENFKITGIEFSNLGAQGRTPLFDATHNKKGIIMAYWKDELQSCIVITAPEPGYEIKAPKCLWHFFDEQKNSCFRPAYLDVSHLDVSKSTDFGYCFTGFGFGFGEKTKDIITSKIIGLETWDVSNGKNFAGMFFKAFPHSSDVCLDLSSWKFSKACRSTLYGLFEDFAEKASKVELKLDWDTSNVTRFKKMFNGFAPMAEDVKIIGIENWAVGQAECFDGMFKNFAQKSNCKLDLTSWSKDHPLLADHYSFSENLFFRIKEPVWVN